MKIIKKLNRKKFLDQTYFVGKYMSLSNFDIGLRNEDKNNQYIYNQIEKIEINYNEVIKTKLEDFDEFQINKQISMNRMLNLNLINFDLIEIILLINQEQSPGLTSSIYSKQFINSEFGDDFITIFLNTKLKVMEGVECRGVSQVMKMKVEMSFLSFVVQNMKQRELVKNKFTNFLK